MEQPLPQCLSTNSMPRAFFLRVAIVATNRLDLVAILGRGLIRAYMI